MSRDEIDAATADSFGPCARLTTTRSHSIPPCPSTPIFEIRPSHEDDYCLERSCLIGQPKENGLKGKRRPGNNVFETLPRTSFRAEICRRALLGKVSTAASAQLRHASLERLANLFKALSASAQPLAARKCSAEHFPLDPMRFPEHQWPDV